MHDESSLLQRCLTMISHLDDEYQWRLRPDQRNVYGHRVAGCLKGKQALTDLVLRTTVLNYHADHALVEALRDEAHPDHMAVWTEWTRSSLRILMSRPAGSTLVDEVAVGLEDLMQEAMIDLLKGLPAFSYQSRFHTWAYTVISNCLVRHYRTVHAQKRAAALNAQSLEVMLEVGQVPPDQRGVSPDEVVLGHELLEIVRQALARHPDQRLATIFQIWSEEEQTLRAIGARLNLSASRVHALLGQAIALLQSELCSQGWCDQDSTTVHSLAG